MDLSLFGNSVGPVDARKLKRTRTVKDGGNKNSVEVAEVEERKVKKVKSGKKKDDDENEDLEAEYMNKLLEDEEEEEEKKEEGEEESEKEEKEESENSEAAEDKEEEIKEDRKRAPKAKNVDLKNSELEKAEATVFVGNLTTEIINDSKLKKQFKKLFEEFGKIQSVRFRSIAFNENLPRKVAFIQKKLDSNNDFANAYIVFVNKLESLKALSLNGTIFHNHHLRVDHLTHPLKEDNKRSIFIGNLDFQEKEESLWTFFEKHIGANEIENVRIIRDSKTNFGKGFAIVQFKDSAHVNKALLLNDKPLDTSEKQRKLRITRCKKNVKPTTTNSRDSKFSQKEKTIIGRGRKILNKSDRATIGKNKPVVEGERATKGTRIKGIKNGLGKKKPRITKRSSNFKLKNHLKESK